MDLFERWTTLDDVQRSGRPSTSRTDEQRAETKELINKQKDYFSEFLLRVGFVYGSKFSIVEVDLNYHEVCVIWVHAGGGGTQADPFTEIGRFLAETERRCESPAATNSRG